MRTYLLIAALTMGAIVSVSVNDMAHSAGLAQPVAPSFIDRDACFIYFIIDNKWGKTIENLFGRVYGYGVREYPGARLVNNPNQGGLKVSLGEHMPGSRAMYRFKIPERFINFPQFALTINDRSIYHPRRTPKQ